MKKIFYLSLLVICSLLCMTSMISAATTAYVNDLCQVNLRSGPGTGYRVVATLSSGFIVEIIGQKDDWSNVRFVKEGGDATEGWILNRFLVDQPPWAAQAKTLSSTLKEQLAGVTEEKNELSQSKNELTQQLQTTTEKLQKLEAEYESFKTGAADYLKLKQEHDATKSALAQAQENVRTLSQEIDDMKLSQKIRWFIAGALVLICGWVIGVMMGRYQRKRRSHFQV